MAGGADTIMLVGGFSSRQYAARYLRRELEAPNRPVLAPAYSRSAVLEGACPTVLLLLLLKVSVALLWLAG